MYDFLRPGVSIANADRRTALSSSFLSSCQTGVKPSLARPLECA